VASPAWARGSHVSRSTRRFENVRRRRPTVDLATLDSGGTQ
jgi:hypothetical protein